MTAPRTIRTQLISLYVALLSLVFICFGAYIYLGFHAFLVHSLDHALDRRAHQIATTLLVDLPTRGREYVAGEMQTRYATDLNERVMRIIGPNGEIIYASKNAADFPWTAGAAGTKTIYHEEKGSGGRIRFAAIQATLADGKTYTVDVGAPEHDIEAELDGLMLMLVLGFPVLIGLSILGGYSLLGRALHPVDEIVRAAERITFKSLSERLPVPQTRDEFERISEALNRMIQRLEISFQNANRFSADASHELRTPLTIIRGELEAMANNETLSVEFRNRLDEILEEVERLGRIVEGLLLVSRLETGEGQMKRQRLDLGPLAEGVADQMQLLAEDKRLDLRCEIEPSVWIEGDEVRLKQVVVNLLDNAIKYTPAGGEVILRVCRESENAILEVADTGIGISAAAADHVFDRFFRAEEVRSGRIKGTGLGLSIVQSIAEAHGGSVQATNRPERGAVFVVRLPLCRSTEAES